MKPKKYLKEVVVEGKRVRWPSKKSMIKFVSVVIGISVFCALSILCCDMLTVKLLGSLEEIFKTPEVTPEAQAVVSSLITYIGGIF